MTASTRKIRPLTQKGINAARARLAKLLTPLLAGPDQNVEIVCWGIDYGGVRVAEISVASVRGGFSYMRCDALYSNTKSDHLLLLCEEYLVLTACGDEAGDLDSVTHEIRRTLTRDRQKPVRIAVRRALKHLAAEAPGLHHELRAQGFKPRTAPWPDAYLRAIETAFRIASDCHDTAFWAAGGQGHTALKRIRCYFQED